MKMEEDLIALEEGSEINWASEGIGELEDFLKKHAAFLIYLDQLDD